MGGPAVTRVRLAAPSDAAAIARIHVDGWRAAYAGLVPDDFLAGLDVTQRAERWRTRLGPAATPDSPTFVAIDDGEAVRGFTHTGPVRDGDLSPAGRAEVYTVYVDPGTWRRGFGSALMHAVDEFWRPTDVRELILWVFEGNADGRAFYERLGWRPDGGRQIDDFGGVQVAEIRYRRPVTPS